MRMTTCAGKAEGGPRVPSVERTRAPPPPGGTGLSVYSCSHCLPPSDGRTDRTPRKCQGNLIATGTVTSRTEKETHQDITGRAGVPVQGAILGERPGQVATPWSLLLCSSRNSTRGSEPPTPGPSRSRGSGRSCCSKSKAGLVGGALEIHHSHSPGLSGGFHRKPDVSVEKEAVRGGGGEVSKDLAASIICCLSQQSWSALHRGKGQGSGRRGQQREDAVTKLSFGALLVTGLKKETHS